MNTFDIILLLLGTLVVSRLLRKRPLGPLPPGPRGLPLVGSVLDIPMTYQWLHFSNWSQRWGECSVIDSNLPTSKTSSGDIISFSMLGQQYVIVNSAQTALDMLEKKSAIYSSRAPIPVAGDMIGWNGAMILQPSGHRMRETRKLLGLVMASTKRVERFHHLVEQETKQFLVGLSNRTDSLVREVQKYVCLTYDPLRPAGAPAAINLTGIGLEYLTGLRVPLS